MSDLYIENFFHHETVSPLKTGIDEAAVPFLAAAASEELINEVHVLFRILKEEIYKELENAPPFPLILKKVEETLLSQNNNRARGFLDDLEELLDLKYLSTTP